MASQSTTTAPAASKSPRAAQVYGMAVICLVAGLAIGYLLRGPQLSLSAAQRSAGATLPAAPARAMAGGRTISLDEMKQIADRQAAPLLERLKSDPNDSALLTQVAAVYHTSHQFKEAAGYYDRAMEADPKNVAVRTKLASSLYRSGDVDGAIAQLNRALGYDPRDANALFDLGMIKLQGKQDGAGALAAWQQLLKSNPELSAERKATVQKLMAEVLTSMGDRQRVQGAQSNGGRKSKSD